MVDISKSEQSDDAVLLLQQVLLTLDAQHEYLAGAHVSMALSALDRLGDTSQPANAC